MGKLLIISIMIVANISILMADEMFTTVNISPSLGTYTRTGFEDKRGKTSDDRYSRFDGLLGVGSQAAVGLSNGTFFISMGGGYYGVLSPKDALSNEGGDVETARFSTITADVLCAYKMVNRKALCLTINNGYRFLRIESNLTVKDTNNIERTYVDGIHIFNNYFIGPTIEILIYHKHAMVLSYSRYIGFNPSNKISIEYAVLHPNSEDRYTKLTVYTELENSNTYNQINAGIRFYGAFWDLW